MSKNDKRNKQVYQFHICPQGCLATSDYCCSCKVTVIQSIPNTQYISRMYEEFRWWGRIPLLFIYCGLRNISKMPGPTNPPWNNITIVDSRVCQMYSSVQELWATFIHWPHHYMCHASVAEHLGSNLSIHGHNVPKIVLSARLCPCQGSRITQE